MKQSAYQASQIEPTIGASWVVIQSSGAASPADDLTGQHSYPLQRGHGERRGDSETTTAGFRIEIKRAKLQEGVINLSQKRPIRERRKDQDDGTMAGARGDHLKMPKQTDDKPRGRAQCQQPRSCSSECPEISGMATGPCIKSRCKQHAENSNRAAYGRAASQS